MGLFYNQNKMTVIVLKMKKEPKYTVFLFCVYSEVAMRRGDSFIHHRSRIHFCFVQIEVVS